MAPFTAITGLRMKGSYSIRPFCSPGAGIELASDIKERGADVGTAFYKLKDETDPVKVEQRNTRCGLDYASDGEVVGEIGFGVIYLCIITW